MKTTRRVGLREAKVRLGRLVRDAQRGLDWIITDRGRPVARIVAIRSGDLPLADRIKRLEATGVVARRPQRPRPLPKPVPAGDWVQRFVREDREGSA